MLLLISFNGDSTYHMNITFVTCNTDFGVVFLFITGLLINERSFLCFTIISVQNNSNVIVSNIKTALRCYGVNTLG